MRAGTLRRKRPRAKLVLSLDPEPRFARTRAIGRSWSLEGGKGTARLDSFLDATNARIYQRLEITNTEHYAKKFTLRMEFTTTVPPSSSSDSG